MGDEIPLYHTTPSLYTYLFPQGIVWFMDFVREKIGKGKLDENWMGPVFHPVFLSPLFSITNVKHYTIHQIYWVIIVFLFVQI